MTNRSLALALVAAMILVGGAWLWRGGGGPSMEATARDAAAGLPVEAPNASTAGAAKVAPVPDSGMGMRTPHPVDATALQVRKDPQEDVEQVVLTLIGEIGCAAAAGPGTGMAKYASLRTTLDYTSGVAYVGNGTLVIGSSVAPRIARTDLTGTILSTCEWPERWHQGGWFTWARISPMGGSRVLISAGLGGGDALLVDLERCDVGVVPLWGRYHASGVDSAIRWEAQPTELRLYSSHALVRQITDYSNGACLGFIRALAVSDDDSIVILEEPRRREGESAYRLVQLATSGEVMQYVTLPSRVGGSYCDAFGPWALCGSVGGLYLVSFGDGRVRKAKVPRDRDMPDMHAQFVDELNEIWILRSARNVIERYALPGD